QWAEFGYLTGLPSQNAVPVMAAYEDAGSGTLEERARAWLDANCAHCHNPGGPANTSGLFLEYTETNSTALGFCKSPVAAGNGSGGHRYAIVPGHPEKSILTYRIKSNDPGVMMPELGRKIVHEEGVALVERWIASLDGGCE
ncbi:MAG TPA: c-type cytochrome domain-containing protein, partial [Flavobacterium sp.]|nr:c-type cytochrome domain-containing protein [Flavobacterium sp.]